MSQTVQNQTVERKTETALSSAPGEKKSARPHNPVVSALLAVLCFAMFCGGLYLMGFETAPTFVSGVMLALLSLFVTWQIIPSIRND
jgi:Kef-type K+ transport system membrane component KefB